ncbi:S1C family serine protease [Paenibacillus sp. J2TS4]|uniref:S1C family serine protease n=1 Tax=Paenibacillus sp. J2TS4 TaxID=2807194 RepID=UPI001B0C9210|nr:trypsin-like peptidase domain-containing protein [Paenibacillus sp. J2TS4]GIP35988.1 putative serine protease YyxA [Paenibacillus sp. J2TS4]
MSLFNDEFYSTKVSRWAKQGMEGGRRWWRNRVVLLILASALTGSLVTFFLMTVFTKSDTGQPLAAGPIEVTELSRVKAVDKVSPTVVSIISSIKEKNGEKVRGIGMGSGVIFQKNGNRALIVTNNHVLEEASSFEVVLPTGEHKQAKVIGSDYLADLAVLEIDAGGIKTVAEFGNSDDLKSGQTAIAIGNPLGGLSQTVTAGIISWPRRTIPVYPGHDGEYEWELEMIQTDAAINQGNSGGALVDLEGRVIGINSLKVADTGVEGLGFAIPINEVKTVIDELVAHGKVLRPFIGVSTVNLSSFKSGLELLKLPEEVKMGAIILEVHGPAKEAGLKTNDVIVEMDNQPIHGTLSLRKYLYQNKQIGEKLNITYYRNGKKLTVTITLAENDES